MIMNSQKLKIILKKSFKNEIEKSEFEKNKFKIDLKKGG